MEIIVEELSALTRRVKVVLPTEDVTKELETAYNKLKSEVQLKGFRKGKVPRSILEKNFGERVKAEVGEKLVQATYFDAIEKEKLDPVIHPEIKSHSFAEDGSFTYEADVDVRPKFELKDYKGLEIEKPEIAVSDAEVETELERLRREMAPLRNVDDRAAQMNDVLVVDFQGYHAGEPIKQVRAENYSVDLGSGRNGKEFDGMLLGMKKGEDGVHEIDFPPAFNNPMLAGKKVEFKIKIREIKERVIADLDDDFARDVGEEFKTLNDLRASIREKKLKEKEAALEGDLADRIMLKLLAANQFEVPERLVQYEIEEYIKQTEQTLQRSGLNLESAGINRQEIAGRYRETAEKRVRGDFILKKVVELEDIKLGEDDINMGFSRIAEQYNMTVDEVKKFFKTRDEMLPFLNELLNEKTLKLLREKTVFKLVPVQPSAAGEKETKTTGE